MKFDWENKDYENNLYISKEWKYFIGFLNIRVR